MTIAGRDDNARAAAGRDRTPHEAGNAGRPHVFVAIDLGAESGRVMVGRAGSDDLVEVHRFANGPVRRADGLHWDATALWREIEAGLAAVGRRGEPVASVGVDTWGVDYCLLDAAGGLLEDPWCYRDGRTAGELERMAVAGLDEAAQFTATGVQPLAFNTAVQLSAHRRADPGIFSRASRLCFLGDWLHHRLGGRLVCEHSIAGSAGLLDACAPRWHGPTLAALGIRPDLPAPLAASGTDLGGVDPALAARCGLTGPLRVICPAVHDTACAASCAPAGSAYLSCGSWSLVGLPLDRPVLTDAARTAGLSNEVAADGRPRLNRNIMGLWVLQRCRAAWVAAGGEGDYARIAALAEVAAPPVVPLDVDDPRFFPIDGAAMPERVQAWYRERSQPIPEGIGPLARAIIDGLAAAYARAVDDLARHAGAPIPRLMLLGGGVRNRLLLERTRACCSIPVDAGPAEATALGNVRIQARAMAALHQHATAG